MLPRRFLKVTTSLLLAPLPFSFIVLIAPRTGNNKNSTLKRNNIRFRWKIDTANEKKVFARPVSLG